MTQNEITRFYQLADVLGRIETVLSASVLTDDDGAPTRVRINVWDGSSDIYAYVRPITDPDVCLFYGTELIWGLRVAVPSRSYPEETFRTLSNLTQRIREL